MFTRKAKYKLILIAIISLSSCSFRYTDKNGYIRSIGLMSIKTIQDDCILMTSTESAGLSIDATQHLAGINIGYRKINQLVLNQDESLELFSEQGSNSYSVKSFEGYRKAKCLKE